MKIMSNSLPGSDSLQAIKVFEDQLGVIATRRFSKGEKVCDFSGYMTELKDANPYCLQITDKLFLQGTGAIDDFINHSCQPNCYADFRGNFVSLLALKNIEIGEQLFFDYNTTELDMQEQERVLKARCVFDCLCNSKNCVDKIKGFNWLTLEQKLARQEILSPLLRMKLMEELWQLHSQKMLTGRKSKLRKSRLELAYFQPAADRIERII